MKALEYLRSSICATVAVLSGCGGLQPPIGAPGAMQQSAGIAAPGSGAATRTIVHRILSASSYQVLYSFRGGPDGKFPFAGLININGTLYGTTALGGANRYGTVFSVTTTGAEKVLYSFGGDSDGANPYASLINVKSTLYGTTDAGGAYGSGTVFSVMTTGTEKVLHSFQGGYDGATPLAGLINVKDTFYGTTFYSGDKSGSAGTVFSVTMAGTEKVLHNFRGGSDGYNPEAGLINVNGTLYGTTAGGGVYGGLGIVFSATRTGTEKVLHSFGRGSDGWFPEAGLINVNGTLYGTTYYGGAHGGLGTVFSVTRTGTEKALYSFGGGSDGTNPVASLINVNGTLYGTTYSGGANGYGTVFSVTTTGTEKVLYSFGGGSDGANPVASLMNVNGTLYGTTTSGGDGGCHRHGGYGTVFALIP